MKAYALPKPPFIAWLAALGLFLAGSTFAQQPATSPVRVAILSHMEGSVAFAPPGQTEWSDAVRNRPVARGDRLWTDQGASAELHLGPAALHMDSHTFVDVTELDAGMVQASLNEGTLIVRVRQLQPGEIFEIDTPNLALRVVQPGSFRIDVDPRRGFTRVAVRSGIAVLHGADGRAVQLAAGQQTAFAGRDLVQATGVPQIVQDTFDVWATNRHRAEDRSIASRHGPRPITPPRVAESGRSWSERSRFPDAQRSLQQRPIQQPPVQQPGFPDRRIDDGRYPPIRPGQDPSRGDPGMRVWPSDPGGREPHEQPRQPRLHQQQIQEQQRV